MSEHERWLRTCGNKNCYGSRRRARTIARLQGRKHNKALRVYRCPFGDDPETGGWTHYHLTSK